MDIVFVVRLAVAVKVPVLNPVDGLRFVVSFIAEDIAAANDVML